MATCIKEETDLLKDNIRRQFYGARRVEARLYSYTDAQPQLDGLSLADLDNEISQRAKELGLSANEFACLEDATLADARQMKRELNRRRTR